MKNENKKVETKQWWKTYYMIFEKYFKKGFWCYDKYLYEGFCSRWKPSCETVIAGNLKIHKNERDDSKTRFRMVARLP